MKKFLKIILPIPLAILFLIHWSDKKGLIILNKIGSKGGEKTHFKGQVRKQRIWFGHVQSEMSKWKHHRSQ